jgi:hypothetical protein
MGRITRRVPDALLIIWLTGAGCGGGGSNPGPPPPPSPDFALSVSPSSINASQGAVSPPLTVSVAGINGFTGAVQVMLNGLPTGAVPSPAIPFSVAAGANVSVTLSVPANAAVGSFTVSANGSSGGLSHAANLSLNIQAGVTQPLTKTTYRRTDSIPLLDDPAGEPHHRHITYDSVNKNLFIANRAMNRVEVFSTADQSSKIRIDAPGASSTDISADGATIWVGSVVEQIGAIDSTSLQIKARYPVRGFTPLPNTVFNRPTEIVSLSGGKAVVRLRQAGSSVSLLALWDPATSSWTNLTSTAPQLFQSGLGVLARSGDHSRVLVAANDTSGEVALFDATGKIVVGPQTVGVGSISFVAANHDASRFAVAFLSNGIQQVLLLDAQLTVIAARTVSSVHGLSFSPDGATLFASEATASLPTIDVLDGMTLHLIGQVSDFAVQGVTSEVEEVSETKMLFGIANRGMSFLDASNPSALSATAPQFSALPDAQPSEGGNSGGTVVTLSGQNFASGSQVIFGTIPASSVTVSSASQILATSPASASVGPVNITVLSPSGWIALAPEAFNYSPRMNQILPNAGAASGGDTIQIYGSGFGSDPSKLTVSIGGQNASVQKLENASTITSSLGLDGNYPFAMQRLTVLAPQAAPGRGDVIVTAPSGSTTLTAAFLFLQDVKAYPNSNLHKFVSYDQKRQWLYLSSIDHIDVFDLKIRSTRAALQPPGGPPPNAAIRGISLTPDSSQLIAADFGAQNVYLFNPDSGAGTIVPVGGIPGFLNSGPARVAATSKQSVFVGMSGEGGTSGACSNCLGQLDLTASPPIIQPAPQPEITMLTGAPLVYADATGDRAFLAFGSAPGGPVAAWSASLPNSFATSSSNASATDLTVAGDGSIFSTLAEGATEIRSPDLTLAVSSATAELERIAGRTVVPGAVLHPSGALLYQPFLSGPPPGTFPAAGLHGGIDIISARTGRLRLRIRLSDPPAMLSSDVDGLHGGFLAVDENGQKIFTLTASGLAVVELGVVPMEFGTVSPTTVSASGGAVIKIRGSGFLTGCTATLGGKSAAVVFVDMNTLNVTVPALAAGPQQLVVTNPGGESIFQDAAVLAN